MIVVCALIGVLLLYIMTIVLLGTSREVSIEALTPPQGEPIIPRIPVTQWNTIGTATYVNVPTWFKLKYGSHRQSRCCPKGNEISESDAWIYTIQGRVVPGRNKEKYVYRVYVPLKSRIGGVMTMQHLEGIVETKKIVDGNVIHSRREMTPMNVKIFDNNWDIPWKSVGWGLFMASENVNPSYRLEGRKIGNKYDFRMFQGIYPKTQDGTSYSSFLAPAHFGCAGCEQLPLRNKMLRNRERVVAKSGNEFMVFITHPEWESWN